MDAVAVCIRRFRLIFARLIHSNVDVSLWVISATITLSIDRSTAIYNFKGSAVCATYGVKLIAFRQSYCCRRGIALTAALTFCGSLSRRCSCLVSCAIVAVRISLQDCLRRTYNHNSRGDRRSGRFVSSGPTCFSFINCHIQSINRNNIDSHI